MKSNPSNNRYSAEQANTALKVALNILQKWQCLTTISFFNGKTPLDIISTGLFGNLYEVYRRIDSMRNRQW